MIAKVSRNLGPAMVGINVESIPQPHRIGRARLVGKRTLALVF